MMSSQTENQSNSTAQDILWAALDSEEGTRQARTTGWNGAVQHSIYDLAGENATQLQGAFIAKFNGETMGADRNKIKEFHREVIRQAKATKEPQVLQYALVTLWVMSFQLRDCRGPGKGLRDLARWNWIELYLETPQTFLALIEEIPNFGYWKDLQQLVADVHEDSTLMREQMDEICHRVYQVYVDQLRSDHEVSQKGEKGAEYSLVAKWIPKEGRSFDRKYGCTSEIAKLYFPTEFTHCPDRALSLLRKIITPLNKAIKTTETLMHQGRFGEIEFRFVTGRCFQTHRRAFFNLKGGSKCKTDDERSTDEDRRQCRANALQYIDDASKGKVKMNTKSLFPHEIVNKFCGTNSWNYNCTLGPEETKLYEAQFQSIYQSLMEKVDNEEMDMGRIMILLDVSGSMYSCTTSGSNHRPVDAAVAIGILATRLTKGALRNRILSFSEQPNWVQFTDQMSWQEMIQRCFTQCSQGMSTDFLLCHERILRQATNLSCQPEQLPEYFLVLSDMQYNNADQATGRSNYPIISSHMTKSLHNDFSRCGSKNNNSWGTRNTSGSRKTHHEILVQAYHEQGLKVCGKPWILPETIYWNLNGSTSGACVQADTPNTQMISGFSPKMLEIVLGGELDNIRKSEPERKITPWDTFQVAMNRPEYDPIRLVIQNTSEGPLQGYQIPIREEEFVLVSSSPTSTKR